MNSLSQIEQIVTDITTKDPLYKGRVYDETLGYIQGPRQPDETIPFQLSESQAVIGLRENISRMPQRYLLFVEKAEDGWRVKERLRTFEG